MATNVIPIASAAAELEIFVYGSIGPWTVSARSISELLKQNPNTKTIRLRVNSLGGSVFEGAAIYNLLTKHSARKVVDIDGVAASAATWIVMAGDERRIGLGGMFMIHEASGMTEGPAGEHEKTAALLRKINLQQIDIYAQRSKLTRVELAKAIEAETWYTGAEALKAGFVTSTSADLDAAAASRRAMGVDNIAAYGFKRVPRELQRFFSIAASSDGPPLFDLGEPGERAAPAAASRPLTLDLPQAKTFRGKTYGEMTSAERANLHRHSEQIFNAMRNEWIEAGEPEGRLSFPKCDATDKRGMAEQYGAMTGNELQALKQRDPDRFKTMRGAWYASMGMGVPK